MHAWEQEPPPILYKYLCPERIDVLTGCRIRFSQRTAFDDDHELQPDYATFGTEGEIWEMLVNFQISHPDAEPIARGIPLYQFVELAASNPALQEKMKKIALSAMKSPDEMSVLCLTETADSTRMWNEYAANATGFVNAFQTRHPGFENLRTPGKFGKVHYSDAPYGSYLGAAFEHGADTFYRKRMKYAFEREWRSIRMLKRLERNGKEIYLAPFDPAAISHIIVARDCSIDKELRDVVHTDIRYRHVQIVKTRMG